MSVHGSTRDRILAEATRLLAERGYGGASMSELATRVGVRKASLYAHVEGKEELLLELLDAALLRWQRASAGVLEGAGSAHDRLRRHFVSVVEFTRDNPHDVAVIRVATTQLSGALALRVQETMAQTIRHYGRELEVFFESAMAAGEIEAAPVRQLVRVWRSFADGLLINLVLPGPASSRRERGFVQEYWPFCWRGLGGRAPGKESRP